jgi:hypothetical protein
MPDHAAQPFVSIVILNWNNAEDTLACLGSVAALDYPAARVIVVDNGSTDDSAARIRAAYPDVELIETGENLGYAGGNNVGVRHALAQGAEYVCILNNDVIVDPGFLGPLVGALQAEADVGIVGPKVYQLDAPAEIQSAGGILDDKFDVQWRGAGEKDQGQLDEAAEIDVAHGCALVLRRQLLKALSGFDERFFMYREEVDLCVRAKQVGYRVFYAPQARVWHRRPNVMASRQAFTTYYMTRNTYLLLSNSQANIASYARVALRHLVWLLNWSVNAKWRHRREDRDALFKALIDSVGRKYGNRAYRYGI